MKISKSGSLIFSGFAVICLLSCSDNRAVRLRYEAEKQLHQAEKMLADAQIKPELTDPLTMRVVAAKFGQVLEFSYGALESVDSAGSPVERRELEEVAYRSGSRLSQLFYAYKRYDTCVAILIDFLDRLQLEQSQLRSTYVNLGQALQASGSWDSALVVFDRTVDMFYPPVDDSGEIVLTVFNIPARVFRLMDMIGDSTDAAERYQMAEKYYRGLTGEFPNSELAQAAHARLARLYEEGGQWNRAITELSLLPDTSAQTNFNVRLKIADIYANQLRDYGQALHLYQELLDSLSEADTLAQCVINFKISMVKMDQGEYAQARKILVDLKEDHFRFYASSPKAQYAMARSFELEGNWSRAETEYNYLIENYRGTDEAMSTFLYLVDYYARQGRQQESDKWFRDAERYFDEMAALGAGTVVEAKALTYKADLYQKKDEWSHSAEILVNLFERYPDSEVGRRALLKASVMYRQKLNNQAVADSLIEVLKTTVAHIEAGWES